MQVRRRVGVRRRWFVDLVGERRRRWWWFVSWGRMRDEG